MKIDTEIRHVTKPGANLFLELGFAPAEARRLQAASRKQINDTRLLKQQLMEELSTWIAEHHLKQAEAAEILMVSRPRVSDVVNKHYPADTSLQPDGKTRVLGYTRARGLGAVTYFALGHCHNPASREGRPAGSERPVMRGAWESAAFDTLLRNAIGYATV